MGGSYAHTTGLTIADVNNAKSWNLGIDARDSIAPIPTQRVDYIVDTNAVMWLDECSSDGPNVNGGPGVGLTFKVAAGGTAAIHLNGYRGMAYPTAVEVNAGGGGTPPDYYTPADVA